MNFEGMTAYLENAGYNIDGMSAEEVDALAEAERFTKGTDGRYHYAQYAV